MRSTREQKDRTKAQTKFWELAGSTLGKVMGVDDPAAAAAAAAEAKANADDVDYKASAQFGAAMTKDHAAQSEFAKTKTIRQQVCDCVVCMRACVVDLEAA